MRLASQVAARQERLITRHVETLRDAVRAGRALLYAFERPEGSTRLEVLGPNGMAGGAHDFLVAPVPTLRLWSPSATNRPIAIAAANRDFPVALETIAKRAAPLVGHELPILLALLAAVREETAGMRFRSSTVGDLITSRGRPTGAAWMSALSLADVQAAVLKAVA